jgi:Ca2+-binding RTX toxin-like protein
MTRNAAVALLLVVASSSPADAAGVPRCDGVRATVVGTPRDDRLAGGPGPDVIQALGGHDEVWAGGGDDRVCGGPGSDLIYGERGHDRLWGNRGRDLVAGGLGHDFLHGDGYRDWLYGEGGWDDIYGGPGDDELFDGHGHDWLVGGPGRDDWNRCPDDYPDARRDPLRRFGPHPLYCLDPAAERAAP